MVSDPDDRAPADPHARDDATAQRRAARVAIEANQKARDAAIAASSPWLTIAEAAAYLKRGRRFIRRQIKDGHLRGAVVGGRHEILTRAEWCDAWVIDHAAPVALPTRRRAG